MLTIIIIVIIINVSSSYKIVKQKCLYILQSNAYLYYIYGVCSIANSKFFRMANIVVNTM